MSEQSNFKVNQQPGDIWLECRKCQGKTMHSVVFEIMEHDQNDYGDIQAWTKYRTCQCKGCTELSFQTEFSCTEDLDEEGNLAVTYKTYPSRLAGLPIMKDAYVLPHGIYKIYKETHSAICNEELTLTGIGIRAIIEAVCINENSTGSNLQQKIDSLVSKGLITVQNAEILHYIRYLGNKAAHEVKAHTLRELSVALEVIEILLKSVYILPRKRREFET